MAARYAHPEPPEAVHWDVAAYALGVLDPAEIERCELHLAECPDCAAELEQFLPVSTLLADVDPNALRELEDPALLERLTCAVHADRRRSVLRQRRGAALATAAAATVAVLALFAGANWLPSDESTLTPPVAQPTPTTTGSEPAGERPTGEQFTGTDIVTGAAAEVVLTARDWGTQVWLELSAVTGPLECQLLLVYADGTAEVAGSWRVPVEGYGTAQQPRPLTLQAAVAADRGQLTELRVTARAPDGTTDTLISVPL